MKTEKLLGQFFRRPARFKQLTQAHDRFHDGSRHKLLIEIAPKDAGFDSTFENAQNNLKELITNRLSLGLIKDFSQPRVTYDSKDWAVLLLYT